MKESQAYVPDWALKVLPFLLAALALLAHLKRSRQAWVTGAGIVGAFLVISLVVGV